MQLLDDLRRVRRHPPYLPQGGFRSSFQLGHIGLRLFHIQRLILVTTIDFSHEVAKLRLYGELQQTDECLLFRTNTQSFAVCLINQQGLPRREIVTRPTNCVLFRR